MDCYETDNVQSFISFLQDVKPRFMTLNSNLDPDTYGGCCGMGIAQVVAQFKGKVGEETLFVEFEFKRGMRLKTGSKKDLLEQLRLLGVDEADIAKLKKISVKTLYGMCSTTISEDEEEVTLTRKEEKDRFIFNAGRVNIKVEANPNHGTCGQLHCRIHVDYKEEIAHLLEVLRLSVPEGTTILENMKVTRHD